MKRISLRLKTEKMKNTILLLSLLLSLIWATPALSQSDTTRLDSIVDVDLASNQRVRISVLRDVLKELIKSYPNIFEENTLFDALTVADTLFVDSVIMVWDSNTSSYVEFTGGGGSSYWSKSGSNLYPLTLSDNVGIGTNSPTHVLTVNGSAYLGKDSSNLVIGNSSIYYTGLGNIDFDGIMMSKTDTNPDFIWVMGLQKNNLDPAVKPLIQGVDTVTGKGSQLFISPTSLQLKAGSIFSSGNDQYIAADTTLGVIVKIDSSYGGPVRTFKVRSDSKTYLSIGTDGKYYLPVLGNAANVGAGDSLLTVSPIDGRLRTTSFNSPWGNNYGAIYNKPDSLSTFIGPTTILSSLSPEVVANNTLHIYGQDTIITDTIFSIPDVFGYGTLGSPTLPDDADWDSTMWNQSIIGCQIRLTIFDEAPGNGFSGDRFTWDYLPSAAACGGNTGGPTEITGLLQDIENGIRVQFQNTTGHVSTDWYYAELPKTAYPDTIIPNILSVKTYSGINGLEVSSNGGVYIDSLVNIKSDINQLAVHNNFLYDNGTEANGYVLTSDANGLATWQAPTSGSFTLDGAYDGGGAGAGATITSDAGEVSIQGLDGFSVTGTKDAGQQVLLSGSGVRMMFNPRSASFRAGYIDNTQWDLANIGEYSIAAGRNVTASGTESTAFGYGSTASGNSSFSVGNQTSSSGFASFSFGESSSAVTHYSISMGQQVTTYSGHEIVIGRWNTSYSPSSTTGWNPNDRLLTVGNGTSSGLRSDALTILKNGNIGIGTSTPSSTLDIEGALQYVDGNQASDYVLTSDANGNASWAKLDCGTGWESISDTISTYSLSGSDTVKIEIDRVFVRNDQLPLGVDSLWDANAYKIIGRYGDAYMVSLDFVATQNSPSATEFKWWIDIGGGLAPLYTTTYDQNKGNGVAKEYNKSTAVYTYDTWEANGGEIYFTADAAITFSYLRVNVFRIHKGR